MEKDKSIISEELDHIRNSINQKNETKSVSYSFESVCICRCRLKNILWRTI